MVSMSMVCCLHREIYYVKRATTLYDFNVDQILSNFLSLSGSLRGKLLKYQYKIVCSLTTADVILIFVGEIYLRRAQNMQFEKVNVDGETCVRLRICMVHYVRVRQQNRSLL